MVASTRANLLGPLTTTFTPPSHCSDFLQDTTATPTNQAWCAQTCTNGAAGDDVNCWPARTGGLLTAPLLGGGFYSPGLICPSGYQPACTQISTTDGQQPGSVSNTFNFQFPLQEGETATGCCPTGFSCQTIGPGNWQTCLQQTTTSLIVALCEASGTSFVSPQVQGTPSAAGLLSPVQALLAPMYQINYQATDLPASSTSSAAISTAAGTASSLTPPSSSGHSSSSDLSTGAKAGIGIGVALGVIAVLGLIFFLAKKQRSKKLPTQNGYIERDAVSRVEMDAASRVEMDASKDAGAASYELPAHRPQARVHELSE